MDPDGPGTQALGADDTPERRLRDRLRAGRREIEAMIDTVLAVEERRLILIDGFNVLHAVLLKEDRDAGWWRREFRERLLRRVGDWPEGGDEIWVAFDGAKPSWSVWMEPVTTVLLPRPSSTSDPERPRGPTVHSVYVESADHWIVRRARRTRHPDRTLIVTADRQVAGRARSAGCEIWTPWAFMSRCPSEGGGGIIPEFTTASPDVADPKRSSSAGPKSPRTR